MMLKPESWDTRYLYPDLEEVRRSICSVPMRKQGSAGEVSEAWTRWDSLVSQGAFFKALGRINWRVVPTAPAFPRKLLHQIQELGDLVEALLQSVQKRLGKSPFLREELGFPACSEEEILWEVQQERPLSVLRLDIAMEAGEIPRLLEIQVVMGGLGITHALRAAYGPHPCLPGILPLYEQCLGQVAEGLDMEQATPVAAVFGSSRSAYRHEHLVLARSMRRWELVVAPIQFMVGSSEGGIRLPDGRRVAVIHRLFRSPNIFRRPEGPGRRVLEALLKDRVRLLNPWKDVLEDKRLLALVHHPHTPEVLADDLSETQWARLREFVPPTWRATPQRISGLLGLTRGRRALYLKRGRSFESRALFHGRKLSLRQWEAACLAAKEQGDWIVQQEVPSRPWRWRYLDPSSSTIRAVNGYIRLCPFFLRDPGGKLRLADVLITAREESSRVHGASDAILVVPGPEDQRPPVVGSGGA